MLRCNFKKFLLTTFTRRFPCLPRTLSTFLTPSKIPQFGSMKSSQIERKFEMHESRDVCGPRADQSTALLPREQGNHLKMTWKDIKTFGGKKRRWSEGRQSAECCFRASLRSQDAWDEDPSRLGPLLFWWDEANATTSKSSFRGSLLAFRKHASGGVRAYFLALPPGEQRCPIFDQETGHRAVPLKR